MRARGRLQGPVAHHLLYSPMRARAAQQASLDRSGSIFDIWDQGPTGSCVAHALLGAILAARKAAGLPVLNLSRVTLYALAREIDRGGQWVGLQDGGCIPAAAIRALRECGAPAYELRPTDPATVNDEPSLAELESAEETLLAFARDSLWSSYAVPSDIDAVKSALASGAFLTVGIAADTATFQDYRGGVLGNQGPSVDHEVLLLDYDGGTVRGVNSWGRGWGESGLFRLDSSGVSGLAEIVAHNVRAL